MSLLNNNQKKTTFPTFGLFTTLLESKLFKLHTPNRTSILTTS
jgi:hypothetical protein